MQNSSNRNNEQLTESAISHLDHTALIMILDDIKEIKSILREHQSETKAEFSRLRDKIDSTNEQFANESKITAVAIKAIETEQKHTASVWGAVAGLVSAIIVTLVGTLARWWIGSQ